MNTSLSIEGMKCDGCVASVRDALENVSGVSTVDVSLDDAQAELEYSGDDTDALVNAVEGAGFTVTSVQ
ncbi:MAG: heavy-metal-associated domain-containing protein [Bacteroidota bacterium]